MKDKPPRIGTSGWGGDERTQVYNANYAPSGARIGDFERPWTAIGPHIFQMVATHAEAIQYAHQEAGDK